ncbi:hypothetical protein TWF569_001013 [Orbilia oligospora]|uniref:Uncharacterized protein n=1 Tax=Orbilia oligospora TaxID=2813651 RepID=A0A7C8NCR3_ORBOL|nr:hypothetical protein TWF102_003606 [Orbilia oligospora]KAF3114057.1 hypothetical protein TWF103_001498 [Orbilia oligospora]KAF3154190.1 hypothetical protein TWF569_001013 [Orbilia oligospora]
MYTQVKQLISTTVYSVQGLYRTASIAINHNLGPLTKISTWLTAFSQLGHLSPVQESFERATDSHKTAKEAFLGKE